MSHVHSYVGKVGAEERLHPLVHRVGQPLPAAAWEAAQVRRQLYGGTVAARLNGALRSILNNLCRDRRPRQAVGSDTI